MISRTLGALALLMALAPAPADSSQTVTRHYTPDDRERERYVYVPVDVPSGTTELRIRYAYDRAQGRNTIDLGLFEPGSLALGTTAMRGYSGGSKSEVTIGECEASPGYRRGKLPAGRWHVMLGLYQVAPAGVDVTLTVDTRQGSECEPRGVGRGSSVIEGSRTARWWSGALHAHTLHSDGALSSLELLRRVREAGLDFVAITDHNNTTHRDEVLRSQSPPPPPLWIVGEEVTTPAGHANVWGLGLGEWVDFRVRPQDRRIGELVDTAHGLGALFSINHPSGECGGCSWQQEVPANLDAVEVWNGPHGAQDQAVALWEKLLRSGRRVTAVGASDWHRDPDPIDNANVRVLADELTESSVLDAIRAGRVIVMRSAREATPTFTVRSGDRTATVGESLPVGSTSAMTEFSAPGLVGGHAVFVVNGQRLAPAALGGDGTARVERALEAGYVRVEAFDKDGSLVALTNPIFLTSAR